MIATGLDKHMGMCSFAVAAPADWNSLHQAIRTKASITCLRGQLTYPFRFPYPSTPLPHQMSIRRQILLGLLNSSCLAISCWSLSTYSYKVDRVRNGPTCKWHTSIFEHADSAPWPVSESCYASNFVWSQE